MWPLLRAFLLAAIGWVGGGTLILSQDQPPAKAAAEVADAEAADADADAGERAIQARMAEFAEVQEVKQDPQYQLLSAYVRVNAALARRACELTEVEEAALTEMNDVWIFRQMQTAVDSPIKNAAAGIARFLQGRAVPVNRPVEQNRQVIERVKLAADKHIEETLTAEHRAAFLEERAIRDKFRYESLARVLVAALDARLFLSAEQRERLEHDVAKWIKKDLYWQFYFQNQNFVPDIPKAILAQVLNKEQLASLKGTQAMLYELAQIELQMIREAPPLIER